VCMIHFKTDVACKGIRTTMAVLLAMYIEDCQRLHILGTPSPWASDRCGVKEV
jgi:hypothetical protein